MKSKSKVFGFENSGGTLLHIKTHSPAQSSILSISVLEQVNPDSLAVFVDHLKLSKPPLLFHHLTNNLENCPLNRKDTIGFLASIIQRSKMAVLESHNGYYLWKYLPSVPTAIIFLLLFITLTAFHTWKIIKTKTWFCTVFAIGGFCIPPFSFPILPTSPIHHQLIVSS
jgi:hypothetical protein